MSLAAIVTALRTAVDAVTAIEACYPRIPETPPAEAVFAVIEAAPGTIMPQGADLEYVDYRLNVYVMTARPGRIKAEIPIPLPRPRTPEMTASPTFQALVRQLKALIREESLAAMGGELGSAGLQGMDHHFSRDGMKALT